MLSTHATHLREGTNFIAASIHMSALTPIFECYMSFINTFILSNLNMEKNNNVYYMCVYLFMLKYVNFPPMCVFIWLPIIERHFLLLLPFPSYFCNAVI